MSSGSTQYTVFVNDEPRQVSEMTTVLDIMDTLKLVEIKGVAVALNSSVISKNEWQAKNLIQGDRILIIRATQGG
ncbi:MAG: sulfur carrier protein ThiS [Verrucomicrobiota bacterium]|jgi:sulfur carrier protein